ncbi:MAG: bifunctional diaminohydroxyphosphoribosylaminopyrimidine deaminase/5-amino-6-(5-phosphoribosylamino)uracil reductase RibD [Cetobacterium sp.]
MDTYFMNIAIEEAKKGIGFVNPNPLVGAVLVKNNKILSKGYHKIYGSSHAEVNAINKTKEANGATLYVTLEPCSHFGKTPPCTDLIISSKIKRCVIATLDSNPLVGGHGVNILKSAGIEVTVGILQKKAENLNKIFFKFIKEQIPYVFLKTAITLDGKIATRNFSSQWITNSLAREKVEKYRNLFSGILVGANTIIQDNPSLKCKNLKNNSPYRLILDKDLILNDTYRVIQENIDKKTFIITHEHNCNKKIFEHLKKNFQINFITFSDKENLKDILKKIGSRNIDSILVEGGSNVITSFFKENLFDGGEIMIAPKILGDNCAIPFLNNFSPKNIKDAINLKNIKLHLYDDNVGFEFQKEEGCLLV